MHPLIQHSLQRQLFPLRLLRRSFLRFRSSRQHLRQPNPKYPPNLKYQPYPMYPRSQPSSLLRLRIHQHRRRHLFVTNQLR